jgi:hypothetical protein
LFDQLIGEVVGWLSRLVYSISAVDDDDDDKKTRQAVYLLDY